MLLLELDMGARFARLELTTRHGLLTLHPDPDGRVHGNVVGPDGVRHVSMPWSEAHLLVLAEEPIGLEAIRPAVAAARSAPAEAHASAGQGGAIVVDDRLEPARVTLSWQVQPDAGIRFVIGPGEGLLVLAPPRAERVVTLDGGEEWPLERDDGSLA